MLLGRLFVIAILLSALSGCCSKAVVVPPNRCIGQVAAVEGLKETEHFDKALIDVAIGWPLEGKLCTGREYVVTKPLTVYRVWDKSKPFSRNGLWWTFSKPEAPVESWRATYAVCPEWGPRDVVSKCQLKTGTKIVVGPGQSMRCEKETYPRSEANQVFVPNKLVNETDYVEQCEDRAWP